MIDVLHDGIRRRGRNLLHLRRRLGGAAVELRLRLAHGVGDVLGVRLVGLFHLLAGSHLVGVHGGRAFARLLLRGLLAAGGEAKTGDCAGCDDQGGSRTQTAGFVVHRGHGTGGWTCRNFCG